MAILTSALVTGFFAASASAEPLSLTFDESRANVGVQLSDAELFNSPQKATFTAQIDPLGGSIVGGELQVPQFSTHITDPLEADVTVDFEIGIISGSFARASGVLTLQGEAGGTLHSGGKECTVAVTPLNLTLSTLGSSGGESPRLGVPFTHGLTGSGAIAGQWSDMSATPVDPGPGGDTAVCETVDERIGGPGGIWLRQEGDVEAPAAPQLTGTDPASPSPSGNPRILGSAEADSTVRIYADSGCVGTPIGTGSAAALASPGIAVEVAEGSTGAFSATATDAAGNASDCSAPIGYTRLMEPAVVCVVPRVKGKRLGAAKRALRLGGCAVGKVKVRKRLYRRPLVVKAASFPAGTVLTAGSEVDLRLGSAPRRRR